MILYFMFRFEYYLRWRLHGRFLKFCNSWLSSVQAGSRMFLSIDHECLKMEETSKICWKKKHFPTCILQHLVGDFRILFISDRKLSFWATEEQSMSSWCIPQNNPCLPCVQQSTCHCQPAILPQSKLICRVLNLDHEILTLSGWSLPLIHWSSQLFYFFIFFICHEFKETLHEMENQHLLPFSCLSLRIDCPFFY